MHLAESISLSCGAKLSKEKLYQKYAPIDSNKFVSFHKSQYDQYQEVINLIKPTLDSLGIDIIQIGGCNYPNIKSIVNVKDYCAASYILNKSLLHFGEYSILFDIAASVGTKSVILNSIGPENVICPFFENSRSSTILNNYSEKNESPYYDAATSKHLVNKIYPENVAESIFAQLGIEYQKPYETVFRGANYRENFTEVNIYPIKKYVYDLQRINNPIIRLDFNYDLEFLERQLAVSKCRIRTNKKIPLEIITKYRSNILGIDLEAKLNSNCAEFIQTVKKNKIELLVYSFENETKSSDLKMEFLDIEKINFQNQNAQKVEVDFSDENLYFKCDEIILYKDKAYLDVKDILNEKVFTPNTFNKVSDFNLSEVLSTCLIVKKFDK